MTPSSPPAPAVPPAGPRGETPAAAGRTDPLAGVAGEHARIVLREARGGRTYALVLHDLYAAAVAELDAMPDGEALYRAWDEVLGRCLGDDRGLTPCLAPHAPHVAMLTDVSDERAWSWEVVVVENGRVSARRSLVALSVHDPSDRTVVPALHVEDVDDDSRAELLVEVPFSPLRDDAAFTWGDEETGGVTYLFDESLAVQARWTSAWFWTERQDDGDSPPRSATCSTMEELADDRSLTLRETCDGREREVRCTYDAAADRYACSGRIPGELFEPWSRSTPHYVGETLDDLRRQLPMLGTELAELHRRAAALEPEP